MPIFGGKKNPKDPGDAFEEAKSALNHAKNEFLKADEKLATLEEWRTFADVKRSRLQMGPDRSEILADALTEYEKSLKNLNQSFSKLKDELVL